MIDPVIIKIIKRCRVSPSFFIDNFCQVKHPKLGTLPFKLFSYQKHCLVSFKKNRFNIFKKCRQCFAAGSMVWTPLGPKQIESIKPGDSVYSLNQLTGQLEISAVGEVFDNGMSECVEVRTKTGHRSISTNDHKYLSHDGWIEANQLTVNDRLVEVHEQPRYGNSPEHSSDPILLGYLLTDGGCNEKNFYFANSRWKYLLEFQKHYRLKFDRRLKIKKAKSGFKPDSDINYRITSAHADAQQWLGSYGLCGATGVNKKIPERVFQWNNESIALLLNRMFAGDGWYSGSHCNEVGIGQQSLEVLHQIKQLLSRFQISSKIYENTNNSIPKLRIFGGQDFARFVEQIGIFGKEPKCDITKGFFFNRRKGEVKSIKPLEGGHKVYDLSIPLHHNYIVDGVVVHNCGISTLTGAYALWYAMFHNNKTVLIVSKRDDDAKEYLGRNTKFAFRNLPQWMQDLWKPEVMNEHTLGFANGSVIRSLTSSPDTLRSNASSLNIIDEAAFIDKMEDMWAGGWSTLQHGGSVIVISTPKGVGNWYWKTWADAVDKNNDFNPIIIDWWDMDWELKFTDELSGVTTTIAPTQNIVEVETIKDIEKYGPGPAGRTFWSPWLEGEYRNLATKGDDSKFRQEVLAEFIGSGDTVLNRLALAVVKATIDEKWVTFDKPVAYVNPNVGEHTFLDFRESLWVWKKPYTQADADKAISKANLENLPIEGVPYPERVPHVYVVGADPSSGEAADYCGVQVIDIITQEQVAELRIKALPKTFAKMIDYIGRWYNNALVVCERTGIGQAVCQELDRDLMYPNLYRHSKQTANLKTKYNQIGYPTSRTTKPILIKYLVDHIGQDGYLMRSSRLYHEFCIFIHLGNNRYGNEPGTGNTDDMAMALCLALAGIHDALMRDNKNLIPIHNMDTSPETLISVSDSFGKLPGRVSKGLMVPYGVTSEMYTGKPSKAEELAKFTTQLGGLPLHKNTKTPHEGKADSVTIKKHILRYFRG